MYHFCSKILQMAKFVSKGTGCGALGDIYLVSEGGRSRCNIIGRNRSLQWFYPHRLLFIPPTRLAWLRWGNWIRVTDQSLQWFEFVSLFPHPCWSPFILPTGLGSWGSARANGEHARMFWRSSSLLYFPIGSHQPKSTLSHTHCGRPQVTFA